MIDINLNIPIDTTPTDGSTNLIDSNAVFDALALKENNLPSIVGNSLKVLRVNAGETAKEWATISTGLTIGTTPITSGTVGRVLFEGAGNVVQEDANFTYNGSSLIVGNTQTIKSTGLYPSLNFENSISQKAGIQMYANQLYFYNGAASTQNAILDNVGLKIGAGSSASARLDIRAQGALSTDIAFRVRNSADNANLLSVSGNGVLTGILPTIFQNVDGSSDVSYRARASLSYFEIIQTAYNDASENLKAATTLGKIAFTGASSQNKLNFVNSATYWGTGGIYSGGFHWYKSEVSGDPTVTRISSSCTNANRQMWLTPENSLILSNTSGITYTTNTDSFQQYSADIVAGNAAPHFRTENGSVIKLYKQNLATNPTNAEIATFLSNLGLANLI